MIKKYRVKFGCPDCGWKGERHPLAQKCGHCGGQLERENMAKRADERAPIKPICPCWVGHWKEVKTPEGFSTTPPKFELSCDYCKRVLGTRGSGPFDSEKAGAVVGKHHEAECEPI